MQGIVFLYKTRRCAGGDITVTNIFHGGYVSRFLPTVEQYPLIYIVIFNVGILYIGDEGIVVSISTKGIEERSKHG